MKIDKSYLHEMYNATSTDDGSGDLESYESWLERQLISRIEQLSKPDVSDSLPETRNCLICGYFCNNEHHANNWVELNGNDH